jgi:hypothetical protein
VEELRLLFKGRALGDDGTLGEVRPHRGTHWASISHGSGGGAPRHDAGLCGERCAGCACATRPQRPPATRPQPDRPNHTRSPIPA